MRKSCLLAIFISKRLRELQQNVELWEYTGSRRVNSSLVNFNTMQQAVYKKFK
jgi:hypothetical protein